MFQTIAKISPWTRIVVLVSLTIAIGLGISTWDINWWPTDAEDYYLDAGQKLVHATFVSDIHKGIDAEKVRWAHGKEFFLLLISFFQRGLNDFKTLRPVVLACIVCIFWASVLIFFILRRYAGERAAFVGWFLFATSAWPIMYILMAKHQPAGLLFFLLAVYSLFFTGQDIRKRFFFSLSGISLGISFFSSTVTALYLPYYSAAFLYRLREENRSGDLRTLSREGIIGLSFVLLGLQAPFLYVNIPDIFHNIRAFGEYIFISRQYNHFFYNQPFLQQWFPFTHVADIRGGWLWVFRYFRVIMPVLFPVYIAGVVYLLLQGLLRRDRSFWLKAAGVTALSLAAPLMAEAARVAQYGANYFPALTGIIFLVVFCFHDLEKNGWHPWRKTTAGSLVMTLFWTSVLTAHLTANAVMFFSDIYPCRMSKTYLSRKIEAMNIHRLYTYLFNEHRSRFIPCLSPRVLRQLSFVPIGILPEAKEGFVLIPPITGDSIYIAATSAYIHFDKDPFLDGLIARRKLKDYAVASYKTLANSRYWIQEEEILSYRNLILKQDFRDNDLLGRVWLLDAGKFRRGIRQNMPLPDDLALMQNNERRIGTARRFLIYKGSLMSPLDDSRSLRGITAGIRKVGAPRDALVAYVYRLGDQQPVWVPAGQRFFSEPLSAGEIGRREGKDRASFRFNPPLALHPGRHYVVIYRTGAPDDGNFYRIDVKDVLFRF